MNKPAGKKNKVKCPSSKYAQENDKDDFILNEHINGVVNGIALEEKCSKKNKRNQKHLNEDNCQILDEKPVNGVEKDSLDESKDVKHTKKKKTKLKESKSHNIETILSEEHSDTDLVESKNVELIENEYDLKNLICNDALASCSKIDSSLSPNTDCSTKEILDVVESLVCMQLEEKSKNADQIDNSSVEFMQYESELQMPMIMKIIQKDLSEPYSIYTYRYFIHNWPKLCFLAMCEDKCVGAIVCKLDTHRKVIKRGYIAMLAVDKDYRKKRIGSKLVELAIEEMIRGDADEVVLETEVTNKPALQLYEKLGFVRDKRLFRYYLNGVDALRLKLWLR